MSYALTGQNWTPRDFAAYLAGLKRPAWVRGITLHHTAAPSLAQRPRGLTEQHMRNLADYYRNDLGWKAGPHLFIDELLIHGLTPLDERGTHARSFNATHLGIEVLGDYDAESPLTGRGLQCWTTAAGAVRALLNWLGLPNWAVNFHRDDPRTTKTCPGKLVTMEWVQGLLKDGVAPIVTDWVIITSAVPGARLARTSAQTLVNGVRVESARYDQTLEATVASLAELKRLNLAEVKV